jgi:hypothetical protein
LEKHLRSVSWQAELGKQVGRVPFSWDLVELEVPGAHALLDPEVLDLKVPHFAESLALADPN